MYKLSDFREVLIEQAVCNFHCKYCHSGFSDGSNCHTFKTKFDKEWWEKNVELVPVEHIAIWGGEPFANFKVVSEIVEYLKPYVGTFTMICNGSLFDIEKAKWCIENNVRVHFSHDFSDQAIRGKDFLKDEKFWEACRYMKENHKPLFGQPEWKISLQRVVHGSMSGFEADVKYLEQLPKEFDYVFSTAIQRGENMPDEFCWTADNLIPYYKSLMQYVIDKKPLAKYFYSNLIKRHFRRYFDIPARFTCAPLNHIAEGKMHSISASGKLYFCHAQNEFDRGIHVNEDCKTCKWAKGCMGACGVMKQKVPCSEWKKLHEVLYDEIDAFVKKVCPEGTPHVCNSIKKAVGDYLEN